MSLKAYDGMMTRQGVKYIQDKITEHLDEFKEASKEKLAEAYAYSFIQLVDNNSNLLKLFEFEAKGEKHTLQDLNDIKIKDNTTVFSYMFKAAKILSESYFVNMFSVHLNITLECLDDKTLVYPHILVKKHRDILLKFLEDWYAQNQSDPPEGIPVEEWTERVNAWYNFDDIQHYTMRIILFNPDHFWDNLVDFFKGDELIDAILEKIPNDESRIRKIAKNALAVKIEKEAREKNEEISVWDILSRINDKNSTEVEDYIKENNIEVTPIDKNFIQNELLINYLPKKEENEENE